MSPIGGDRLRGNLDLLVLAVLRDAPGHGYDVGQRLGDRSGGVFELHQGSLYPSLYRLERAGLLSSQWQAGAGGPRRRVYTITTRGARALAGEREEWQTLVTAVTAVIGPKPA